MKCFCNQHREPPTCTLLLACILTKSLFSFVSCLFFFTRPQYIYCARYIVLLKYRQFLFFSTISFIRMNLFLSFDFFHISIFFTLGIKNFEPITEEFVFNRDRLLSSFHLDHVIHFCSTSLFRHLFFNSFGGTLLAVRDWTHQGSPRAAVGFGPKA